LVYFCHKNITNSTIPVFLQFSTAMLKLQTLRNHVITDAVKRKNWTNSMDTHKIGQTQWIQTKLDKLNGYTQN
jgi:hypothetical protein